MRNREPDEVPISVRLLTAIKQRNLRPIDVARQAGVSPGQLTKILTGQSEPRWDTLEHIRRAIGAPTSEIYDETEVNQD